MTTQLERYREISARLFDKRLADALNVARGDNTAIVIVPPQRGYTQVAINTLVHMLNTEQDRLLHALRIVGGRELHFEGTRGSVRIYPADHITYDSKKKRLIDYPATVPHFLHPEVEGL